MKSIEKNTEKRIYKHPEIVCVELDNDISLALQSSPPIGPSETNLLPDYLQSEPFKSHLS